MLEIVILGRGGQGAQTAGNQLARALFDEGLFVQVFATYGGARRGTPVASSLRADQNAIRLRSDITQAGALLCFDESLLNEAFLNRGREGALVVVNSAHDSGDFQAFGRRILTIDGRGIAQRNNMGKVVNSALLGGFTAALGQPTLDAMCAVIEETAPAKVAENIAACREAYGVIAGQLEEV